MDEQMKASITRTSARLHASAAFHKLTVSGDFRVNEKGAAFLLGFSPGYFKALRQQGNGPMFYALGLDGGRYSYQLDDLASWIEMARETSNDR